MSTLIWPQTNLRWVSIQIPFFTKRDVTLSFPLLWKQEEPCYLWYDMIWYDMIDMLCYVEEPCYLWYDIWYDDTVDVMLCYVEEPCYLWYMIWYDMIDMLCYVILKSHVIYDMIYDMIWYDRYVMLYYIEEPCYLWYDMMLCWRAMLTIWYDMIWYVTHYVKKPCYKNTYTVEQVFVRFIFNRRLCILPVIFFPSLDHWTLRWRCQWMILKIKFWGILFS